MGHPVEIVKGPTDDYYLLREGRLHRIREEATLRDVGIAHGLCFEDKRDLSPKELNLLIPGPEMPDTTPRIVQSQEDGKLYLIKRIILGVEAESVITKREIPNPETLLALTGDIPNKVFLRQTLDAFKNDPGIPDYYGLVALAASPLLIGGKEWRHQYLLLGKIRRHIPFSTKHRTREIVGEPSDWYSEKQLEQETLEGIPVRSAEWLAELWRKSGEKRLLRQNVLITPNSIRNRWALLVGINEYEDSNYGQLHVCVTDAETIRDQLVISDFDSQRVHLLTDQTQSKLPSRDNILVTLKAIADATDPDDLLLFYYSGHGDEDNGESYLIARNGRRLVLSDTAVRISRVKEIMEQAPARAKVMILDACHSGADIGGKGPKLMSEAFIQRVFEQAEGLAILASCKQGQVSYEWPENRQSVFTHYLLQALRGDADRDRKGFVTVQDVHRHVTDGVKLWASQRNYSQTPTLHYIAAGDIVLVRYPPEVTAANTKGQMRQ